MPPTQIKSKIRDFALVALTWPEEVPSEAEALERMAGYPFRAIHLRKPGWNKERTEQLLQQLSPACRSRLPRQNPAPRPFGIGKGIWLAGLPLEPAQPARLPANRKRCRNSLMARQGHGNAGQCPRFREQIRRSKPDSTATQPVMP